MHSGRRRLSVRRKPRDVIVDANKFHLLNDELRVAVMICLMLNDGFPYMVSAWCQMYGDC